MNTKGSFVAFTYLTIFCLLCLNDALYKWVDGFSAKKSTAIPALFTYSFKTRKLENSVQQQQQFKGNNLSK
jgi:hypothetical protein